MKGHPGVNTSRLFVAAEAVLEVVQERGGTVFGDELAEHVMAWAPAGSSSPLLTRDEVSEAVAFLVRMGFLETSDRSDGTE